MAGRNRRSPFGADGHGHRVTIDDGGGDELAVLEVVHNVDKRPVRPREGRGAGIFGGILVSGIEEHGAEGIAGLHGAANEAQTTLGGPLRDLGGGVGREDG